MNREFEIGDVVIHRAWKYRGVVTDVDFDYSYLGHVQVKWDHLKEEQDVWIPSIMLEMEYYKDDEEFDWGELIETT